MLQPEPVCLLIAAISGYTRYLAGVELDHSQDILADLIGTIVTALRGTHMTPSGPVKMLETIELEPTATGTIVHFRYGRPRTAKERAIMASLEPMYRDVVAARMTKLVEQLDAEMAARGEQADEPKLPAPRADDVLAGLAPGAMAGSM